LRRKSLGFVLIADGADGYRATFALAELDPTIGARRVVLADATDGKWNCSAACSSQRFVARAILGAVSQQALESVREPNAQVE